MEIVMQVPDVTASYLIITTSRWICRGIAALGDGASIVFGPSEGDVGIPAAALIDCWLCDDALLFLDFFIAVSS